MSRHSSDVPTLKSDRTPPLSLLVTKRLPVALFSHILLLGLTQAVTHIVAPAAKPPPVTVVRIANKKDNGTRKKRLSSDKSTCCRELQASHFNDVERSKESHQTSR